MNTMRIAKSSNELMTTAATTRLEASGYSWIVGLLFAIDPELEASSSILACITSSSPVVSTLLLVSVVESLFCSFYSGSSIFR